MTLPLIQQRWSDLRVLDLNFADGNVDLLRECHNLAALCCEPPRTRETVQGRSFEALDAGDPLRNLGTAFAGLNALNLEAASSELGQLRPILPSCTSIALA